MGYRVGEIKRKHCGNCDPKSHARGSRTRHRLQVVGGRITPLRSIPTFGWVCQSCSYTSEVEFGVREISVFNPLPAA